MPLEDSGNLTETLSVGGIVLKYNNDLIASLTNGFQDFQYCSKLTSNELEKSYFQLKSTTAYDFRITGLFWNGTKLLVGKNGDNQSFWLNQNKTMCLDNKMITDEITIKNGNVITSSCKSNVHFRYK